MEPPPSASPPLFTVVSAVYNVERYLPAFIAAIEAQDFDLERLEVVAVDDGSTDGSLAQLKEWANRRPDLVRVVSQENAGQGAARNAGLELAQGTWVTFPDPDDVVDPNYFSTVAAFIEANPTADMVATNRWLWYDERDELRNDHPLETFFRYDRLVDLEGSDGRFHGSSPAAFFRLADIREHDLSYDARIRPNFEDGHFCSLYLLHHERPQVGFLQSTRYHYRKRSDQSSSLGSSMTHPGRYTDVFTYGYLAILREAIRLRGEVPTWLKHFLCYEIAGYFAAAQNNSVAVLTDGPIVEQFHEHVRAVLAQAEPEKTLSHHEFRVAGHARLVTMHGYSETPWRDGAVYLDKLDTGQQLVRARYRFTGAAPHEEIGNGDAPSRPRHAKTRNINYFGRTLMQERILWLRYRPDLRIRLDGVWQRLVFDQPEPAPPTKATPTMVRRYMVEKRRATYNPMRYLPTTRPDKIYRRLALSPPVRKKYARSWVLMDRIHNAGDSGEILFKHIRANHPEINAWFVLAKESGDYDRLRKEGHGDRLVAHGTRQWRLLMANCEHLLASHADEPVVKPPQILDFIEPQWRFTFLQHGVIKDDLSRWLNYKSIDLFVTSTVPEYNSIAGELTTYPFTTKETVLTGLPRFDRLREIGQRYPAEQRDLVLLTPTWRQWLVQDLAVGSQERHLGEGVLASRFVQEWVGLLGDPELAQACERAGVRLAFLPHPNLEKLLPHLDLPPHVMTLSYEGIDVQELFARARVLVTDYSSIAFNAAYLDRPVVYFQFDAAEVLAGAHVGQRGYFEYERDGFGPVVHDRGPAVSAVVEALDAGGAPLPSYAERIEATFPLRDGGCSERVVQAVLASTKRDRNTEAVPTPVSEPAQGMQS
jgi:glycosyltransferase involved in cell wall biosynthesis